MDAGNGDCGGDDGGLVTVEGWTTIRFLHAQGQPIKAIARELKLSRNTVKRVLRLDEPPRYCRPPRPNPQIEPFRADIVEMVSAQETLAGSRMLEELQAKGYAGSKTAFYDFLRTLRHEQAIARKTRVRFETAPGEQAQFDWSPYRVRIGGELVVVQVFRTLLGFSRRQALWPSRDHTWMSVYEALEEGLWRFGGVPKGVVVDNDRCFVTKAFPGGQWSPRWIELCGHYAFEPVPCTAYHPESKGKVENPFRFLEDHFIKGNTWTSWEAFCHELRAFEDRVNARVHGTTGQPPIERFEQERHCLTALPRRRFVATDEEWRSVSWDCLIPWKASRYEVPPVHANRRLRVRESQGTWLHIFDAAGERVATHRLSARKGQTILGPAQGLPRQRTPRTRVLLQARFQERFPDDEAFLQALVAAHPERPSDALRAVLNLAAVYPATTMRWAFAVAIEHHTFTARFLTALQANAPAEVLPPTPIAHPQTPQAHVHRELVEYNRALTPAGGAAQ